MGISDIDILNIAWNLSRVIYGIEQFNAAQFDIFSVGELFLYSEKNAKLPVGNDDTRFIGEPLTLLLNELKKIYSTSTGEFNKSNGKINQQMIDSGDYEKLFIRRIYSNGARPCILVIDDKKDENDDENDDEITTWVVTRGSDKLYDIISCLNTATCELPTKIAEQIKDANKYISSPLLFHNGLIQNLNTIEEGGIEDGVFVNLNNYITELLKNDKCCCSAESCKCSGKKPQRVIYTGHSLGGAISEILATTAVMSIGSQQLPSNSSITLLPFCGFRTLTKYPAGYMRTYKNSTLEFKCTTVRNSMDIIGADNWTRFLGLDVPLFGNYKQITKKGYFIQGGGLSNGIRGPYSIHPNVPTDIGSYFQLPTVIVNSHLMNNLEITGRILVEEIPDVCQHEDIEENVDQEE